MDATLTTIDLAKIIRDAHEAAETKPRTGGMNAAWAAGYGSEGEYNAPAKIFCTAYLDRLHSIDRAARFAPTESD